MSAAGQALTRVALDLSRVQRLALGLLYAIGSLGIIYGFVLFGL